MKAEYINPFIESVDNVFQTMLGVTPKRGAPHIAGADDHAGWDISALIGLSGKARGMVALCFPTNTALSVITRLFGEETNSIDQTVIDGISEFVNMVAGSAKAKFNTDPPIDIGLPMVVRGSNYRLEPPSRAVWLSVPFESELGPFVLEVSVQIQS
ncbi:MAG TPA: chemotaxis protein CheX [Chroococcales cyanobacterium]